MNWASLTAVLHVVCDHSFLPLGNELSSPLLCFGVSAKIAFLYTHTRGWAEKSVSIFFYSFCATYCPDGIYLLQKARRSIFSTLLYLGVSFFSFQAFPWHGLIFEIVRDHKPYGQTERIIWLNLLRYPSHSDFNHIFVRHIEVKKTRDLLVHKSTRSKQTKLVLSNWRNLKQVTSVL